MGWETRNGKRVYYRKVREGARVRSIYCGSGERGEAAAREDAERSANLRNPKISDLRKLEISTCATADATNIRDVKKAPATSAVLAVDAPVVVDDVTNIRDVKKEEQPAAPVVLPLPDDAPRYRRYAPPQSPTYRRLRG